MIEHVFETYWREWTLQAYEHEGCKSCFPQSSAKPITGLVFCTLSHLFPQQRISYHQSQMPGLPSDPRKWSHACFPFPRKSNKSTQIADTHPTTLYMQQANYWKTHSPKSLIFSFLIINREYIRIKLIFSKLKIIEKGLICWVPWSFWSVLYINGMDPVG